MVIAFPAVDIDFAPYRLTGVVYGVLLNHRPALDALGSAVNEPPYKAPPLAPILYQKPRNTLSANGASVVVPNDSPELELGVALGIVIGRTACRVGAAHARAHIAGYLAIADICVPHASFYRPSLRFRARDGFCVLGPAVTPSSAMATPDALAVSVQVDGQRVHQSSTGDRIRDVNQLLVDVSEFMTLVPGDIVMTGICAGAPKLKAGQQATVQIEGLDALCVGFVADRSDL